MTGYSDTSLAKKLGIKAGAKVMLINAPDHYLDLFTDLPPDVYFTDNVSLENDVIHFFSKSADEYRFKLPELMKQIKQNGVIWVSWPKKSSKVVTDITEDLIRNFALQIGLVDIKVCAVDEIWSGLKLVIPVKDRKYMV
ncbi:DUF3052 domain-containing protein [Mucilaginibacter sp. SMC90]|uniref:DUF3052 domain-containing protein n=1 Tax=Mucilaginibacter sp. SMC90 TaxID=2929803 RepID=UPI001FB26C92|nr:DUF3052 domain-containing protein [Mucilaginibacter sp. SMC90]UOE46471.1 DUF3052 domain-containing protein [Mucilaginibacter sp. SMC90]